MKRAQRVAVRPVFCRWLKTNGWQNRGEASSAVGFNPGKSIMAAMPKGHNLHNRGRAKRCLRWLPNTDSLPKRQNFYSILFCPLRGRDFVLRTTAGNASLARGYENPAFQALILGLKPTEEEAFASIFKTVG
ncbi:MAG: hypothetical protein LBV32_03770 [Tannerellaceae bacterium]|jgi:hypothetical protein|nr:hypothetical protein [Tannerellaceae bacterium]